MASKKGPVLDGDAIARAIANGLPGWTLSRQRAIADDVAAEAAAVAAPGVTIKTLRAKFLGPDTDSDADSSAADTRPEDYGVHERNRTTCECSRPTAARKKKPTSSTARPRSSKDRPTPPRPAATQAL